MSLARVPPRQRGGGQPPLWQGLKPPGVPWWCPGGLPALAQMLFL